MSITVEKTKELIKVFGKSESDTGSVDVQCALLSERIRNLTDHLGLNKHDTQAKRGLIALVSQRRKLLRYLESRDTKSYADLIKRLGIRK